MLGSPRRKRFLTGLLIATSVGVVSCLAFGLNLLSTAQLRSSDFLFGAANAIKNEEQDGKVVIVAIDDESLDQLGRFSLWPRTHYARLIDTLGEAKARVVVFDILFSEPAPDDEQLAASIRDAGNVILPIVETSTATDGLSQPPILLRSLEIMEENAIALGHANLLPDKDGVVRRLPVAISNGEDHEPALALSSVAKYLHCPAVIESPVEEKVLHFAGRTIPIGAENDMLINYADRPAAAGDTAFRTVSFVDVLRGELDAGLFQDRIVIVGATATGLGDAFWTPMGRMMSGVEIHANAIHTILTASFLAPASTGATIVSILVLALLCGLMALRLPLRWAAVSALSLGAAYFLVVSACFDTGAMLNMLYPPLAILGSFAGTNLYNVASERSQRSKITRTFGKYVSAPVVDGILATLEQGGPTLGGQEQQVTVAFADVREFSKWSETVPPEELVSTLNIYLSLAIKAVLTHGGMINKFGGDSIMAVWNAPVACEEHPLLAIEAAMEAQHSIRDLQRREPRVLRMELGIGINTGVAVAGNMGSAERLEYSVVGDAVNVAARLTAAARGGKVWIGASTFELARDCIVAKPLGELVVRGKREPVKAYEVLHVLQQSSQKEV